MQKYIQIFILIYYINHGLCEYDWDKIVKVFLKVLEIKVYFLSQMFCFV